VIPRSDQRAASRFDSGACTCRSGNALEHNLARQFTRLDHFGVTYSLANDTGLLERLNIDFVDRQRLQFGETYFSEQVTTQRCETTLGQTTLQRHLTAFEADFMETACAGLLTLVATAGCFAEPGTNAATYAAASMLTAFGGCERIELSDRHHDSFQTSETVTR